MSFSVIPGVHIAVGELHRMLASPKSTSPCNTDSQPGIAHHSGQRRRVLAGRNAVPKAEQAVDSQQHHREQYQQNQPRAPQLSLSPPSSPLIIVSC
jgi:hypothetical protein